MDHTASRRFRCGFVLAMFVSAGLLTAGAAQAEVPTAKELAKRVGLSDSETQKTLSGEFVEHSVEASNPRELTAGFAFVVEGSTPTQLVDLLQKEATDEVDPAVEAHAFFGADPKLSELAKVSLSSDTAKEFGRAKADGDLNLSADEIAALKKVGTGSEDVIEAQVRALLLARLLAYQKQGLAGIAPYQRGDGKTRSAADDLRSAVEASKQMKQSVPDAYALLLDYPKGKPAGMRETFRWSKIDAHGEPTLVLTHAFAVPDGDAWVVAQRQFYVSTGYNCEQAVAAFLPVSGGTAVFYANRTSTDQVTGFGGSAKRGIGSKLLANQLKTLFEKVRKQAGDTGG